MSPVGKPSLETGPDDFGDNTSPRQAPISVDSVLHTPTAVSTSICRSARRARLP